MVGKLSVIKRGGFRKMGNREDSLGRFFLRVIHSEQLKSPTRC